VNPVSVTKGAWRGVAVLLELVVGSRVDECRACGWGGSQPYLRPSGRHCVAWRQDDGWVDPRARQERGRSVSLGRPRGAAAGCDGDAV